MLRETNETDIDIIQQALSAAQAQKIIGTHQMGIWKKLADRLRFLERKNEKHVKQLQSMACSLIDVIDLDSSEDRKSAVIGAFFEAAEG
jgi:ABC-type polar amino acid transport system ATPase subunit